MLTYVPYHAERSCSDRIGLRKEQLHGQESWQLLKRVLVGALCTVEFICVCAVTLRHHGRILHVTATSGIEKVRSLYTTLITWV